MAIELTTKEMAEVLGISTQRLHKLSSDGVVAPLRRGCWDAADVVQRVVAKRLDGGEASQREPSEMDKLRAVRRQNEEIELQRNQRALIDIDEALEAVSAIAGIYLEALSSIPARVTRNSRERQRIEAIIDEVRARVAARFGKVGEALRNGEPVDETGAEADTE